MATFVKGDTVELNSGGPVMTVIEVLTSGDINCTWYSKTEDKYKDQQFPVEALTAEVPDPPLP